MTITPDTKDWTWAHRPPQRRGQLHRGDLRPVLRARPGAPSLRRHRPPRRTDL